MYLANLATAVLSLTPIALGIDQWNYSTSKCAAHNYMDEDFHHRFEFGPPTEKRIHLHWDCADLGAQGGVFEYALMTLRFDMEAFLTRALRRPAEHGAAAEEFAARVDAAQLQSGLHICAPAALCFDELQGMRGIRGRSVDGGIRGRDLHWWRRRENLSLARAGHFICSALLWSFLGRRLNLVKVLLGLPSPTPTECAAEFADVGQAWQAYIAHELAAAAPSARLPSLAVCLQGGVRSFTRQEVYTSIRENVIMSLAGRRARVFYVLNLTSDSCTWCSNNEVREFELTEIAPAMAAIGSQLTASVVLEPACCWPELSDGLSYSDCFPDNIAAPVQARGKQVCASSIAQYEFAYGSEFDFVLWTRPDLTWRFPMGDLRAFSAEYVHSAFAQHAELSDLFALIPRRFLPVYVSAYRDADDSGYKFRCLTREEQDRALMDKICDYPGLHGCWRCGHGSIGCLLQAHLLEHAVPLRRIPFEIAERSRRPQEVPI